MNVSAKYALHRLGGQESLSLRGANADRERIGVH